MKFLTNLTICAIVGSLLTTQLGCATLHNDLPNILTYIQDGTIILQNIQIYVDMFLTVHPDPTLQTKFDKAIAEAQTALDAGLRATQGAQDLTDKQYADAFAPFLAAYNDLTSLLKEFNITVGDVQRPTMTSTGMVIPTPLIVVKLHK